MVSKKNAIPTEQNIKNRVRNLMKLLRRKNDRANAPEQNPAQEPEQNRASEPQPVVVTGTLPAFSLSELLVVLVIIGILVLIALPNLMPLISRAKSTEAQQQLTFLHTLQKNHFYTHSRYSDSPAELGFEQQRLVSDGGAANYLIEITEASEHGFTATATAVVDFDGNGVFNVWEIDQDKQLRETVKD